MKKEAALKGLTTTEIRGLILSAVAREVETKFWGVMEDIKIIKKTLIGDPDFNEKGLKKEHDEMWQFYSGAKFMMKALGITNLVTAVTAIVAILKAFGVI